MTLREATRILSAHSLPPPLTWRRDVMRLITHYTHREQGELVSDTRVESVRTTRAALLAWLGY